MNNERSSNIEILRIFSMFLILMYHIGGTYAFKCNSTIDILMMNLLCNWGILGVDVFIIISTYFLRNTSVTSFAKTKRQLYQVFIYLLSFYFVNIVINVSDFGSNQVLYKILLDIIQCPLFIKGYWFVWAYLALYVLAPFINGIKLDKRIVIPILIIVFLNGRNTTFCFGADTVHMICVYIISKYAFENYDEFMKKNRYLFFFVIAGIMYINSISKLFISSDYVHKLLDLDFSFERYSFGMIFCALGLFYIFRELHINTYIYINSFASTMFGVYLFHECEYFKLSSKIGEVINLNLPAFANVLLSSSLLLILGSICEYLRIYFRSCIAKLKY